MSLHNDFQDMIGLARTVFSDKKEEKERKEKERKTIELVCPYCGTTSKYVWEDGKLPTCQSCGAAFDADNEQLKKYREEREMEADTDRRVYEAAALEKVKTKSKIRRYIIIGVVVVVLLTAAVIAAKLNGGNLHLGGGASFNFHVS